MYTWSPRNRTRGLLLALALAGLAGRAAEPVKDRGLRVVEVATAQGRTIPLYSNSFALVVGNGQYRVGYEPLPEAEEDVRVVKAALERNGFIVQAETNLDREGFDRALYGFLDRHGRDPYNRVLIYYSGHGETVTLANGMTEGALVMVEAPAATEDPAGFYRASVSMRRLYEDVQRFRAHHVLVMMDACFSGTLLSYRAGSEAPRGILENVNQPVRQFITAGSAGQPVPAQSLFRRVFVDLLEGRRPEATRDGYLTGKELAYLMSAIVAEEGDMRQTPQHALMNDERFNQGDFVFVLTPP